MVRLRFQRLGRHNRPFYRLAAIDQRTRRDGVVIESLGWFNPVEKDAAKAVQLNEERVKHWISVGAQPTDTVRDFLAKRGLVDVKAWEKDREHDRKRLEKRLAAKAAAGEEKKEEAKA
ncbi:MAG: 30S ribosomal protein S16 [Phycisphaerales bacterium]|nr:30S ribosomal protein S16 [Planctomycetota bacterium]